MTSKQLDQFVLTPLFLMFIFVPLWLLGQPFRLLMWAGDKIARLGRWGWNMTGGRFDWRV